jgi:predicted TPR repeat methyltransferase
MDEATFERARALFFEGNALLEAGACREAETRFEAALALVPGRVSILVNLGAARVGGGRHAEALDALDQALEQVPDDLEAWSHRGVALAGLGRHAEALDCHERVLARAPERAANWLRRGEALQRLERPGEALDAYARALTLDPTLAAAWSQRGGILRDAGRLAEAAHAFEQALAHGGDRSLNGYYLAAATGREAPASAPPPYVEAFFDEYAPTFDEHLVGLLGYRAPQVLVERLVVRAPRRWRSVLDLGCGTGLCGPLLRPRADHLAGIDLSARMLELARARGVYDELVQADVAAHLATTPARHDLVLATDVFIYIGDLAPVIVGAARVLEAGGWLAFTAEAAADDDAAFVLQPSLRYAHGEQGLRRLAAGHGFDVEELLRAPLREDQGRPVDGLYALWRRRA